MRWLKKGVAVSAIVSAIALLGACASGGQTAMVTPESCVAPVSSTGGAAIAQSLRPTEYRLVLVSTRGQSSGSNAMGELTLMENDQEHRMVTQPDGQVRSDASAPLYGSTTINREDVGAFDTGWLGSTNPESPGVLVLTSGEGAGTSVTLRLGANSNNRRGPAAIDGAYFALRPSSMNGGVVSGEWSSGVGSRTVGGHFCMAPEASLN